MPRSLKTLEGHLNEPYRFNEVLDAARTLRQPFTMREVANAARLPAYIVHQRLLRAISKGILWRQKGPVTLHGFLPKQTYLYSFVKGR